METKKCSVSSEEISRRKQIFCRSARKARKDPFNFRIHNNCQYIYTCTNEDLLKQLKEVHYIYGFIKMDVLAILDDENDYTIDHQDDISHIKQMICNFELLFLAYIINVHIMICKEKQPIESEMQSNRTLEQKILEEINNSSWCYNLDDLIGKAKEIEHEHFYIKSQYIKQR